MGTSFFDNIVRLSIGDHPHAYGDKSYFANLGYIYGGSSPRVWGQAGDVHIRKHVPGIIPTRMGTSPVLIGKIIYLWDHPHAYGDKDCHRLNSGLLPGSSPRVWGQADKATATA